MNIVIKYNRNLNRNIKNKKKHTHRSIQIWNENIFLHVIMFKQSTDKYNANKLFKIIRHKTFEYGYLFLIKSI